MLRTTPGTKFQASRNLVRTPLKPFPKQFKANEHSSFYYPLTSSPKLSIPKAMKHSSQDSKEEPLPGHKASSKGFRHEFASLFHVSHDEGKPALGKLQRSRSGRKVLNRLASEHECTDDDENLFMKSIDQVDLEELERLISRMRKSTRIEEAIQKIENHANMIKDHASQLELSIVELLIYKVRRKSTKIEAAIKKAEEEADKLKDQAYQLELLIIELLIYKGDYVEAYKKVLPVVANPPEGDLTPHLLLGVIIYQKVQEVNEPQQGEASKDDKDT